VTGKASVIKTWESLYLLTFDVLSAGMPASGLEDGIDQLVVGG